MSVKKLTRTVYGIKKLQGDVIAVLSAPAGVYALQNQSKIRVEHVFVHALFKRNSGQRVKQVTQSLYIFGKWKETLYRARRNTFPDTFDMGARECAAGIHFIPCSTESLFQQGWYTWMAGDRLASAGDFYAIQHAQWLQDGEMDGET